MAEADELFNESPGQDNAKKSEADKLFESQPGIELTAKRPTATDNGGGEGGEGSGHGDIDDVMANSRKKSDIEILIQTLFPKFPITWLNPLLVTRVFPDELNHMQVLCVKEIVATTKMTVVEAWATVYAVLRIAIDGESRIDGIHIIKGGGELEDTKAQNKGGMI